MKVDARVKSLPKEAQNVYFEEWCGIDCSQIIRFDLPADIAHEVMSRYSIVEIGQLPARNQRGLLRAQIDGPPLHWWLKEAVPDAEGVSTDLEVGQLTEFIMIPVGDHMRIYMRAFDM